MTLDSMLSLPHISRRTWMVWRRNRDVFTKTIVVNFIPPIAEPVIYIAAFGFGLGLLVTQIAGHSYAEFIAPALVAITIMNASFFECTFASFVRMYYQKTFDAIVSTPLNVDEVIAGEILWGATRSTISATVIMVVIALFGLVHAWTVLIVIPFSFLGGIMFASIAMCFTAVTPKIENLNYPTSLFVMPMTLVSNTFFPLTLLPGPVQTVAEWIVPLLHVTNIVRAATWGDFSIALLWSLLWILIVTAVFFIVAINLMKRRLIV
jgi:lipooligosaccharide transport system permease protein